METTKRFILNLEDKMEGEVRMFMEEECLEDMKNQVRRSFIKAKMKDDMWKEVENRIYEFNYNYDICMYLGIIIYLALYYHLQSCPQEEEQTDMCYVTLEDDSGEEGPKVVDTNSESEESESEESQNEGQKITENVNEETNSEEDKEEGESDSDDTYYPLNNEDQDEELIADYTTTQDEFANVEGQEDVHTLETNYYYSKVTNL